MSSGQKRPSAATAKTTAHEEADPKSSTNRSSSEASAKHTSEASAKPSDRIIDALMSLAAEQPYAEITLTNIAERAHVSLAEFRALFPSKGAILGAFGRRIDQVVLSSSSKDLENEPARERLFDAFMRRLDALTPYKLSLESINGALKTEPFAAAALNQQMLNSMRFMLAYAGLERKSDLNGLKLQGLVFAWRRVFSVWLSDDEPGIGRTMAEIDRVLTRGDQILSRLEDAHRLTAPLRHVGRVFIDAGRAFHKKRVERSS